MIFFKNYRDFILRGVRSSDIKPTKFNADRIVNVLKEFGFGSLGLTAEDFQSADQIVQLGVPPVRIDLITSITGVTWDEANDGAMFVKYGNIPVKIIGKEALIKNKLATGRKKDLADAEALNH